MHELGTIYYVMNTVEKLAAENSLTEPEFHISFSVRDRHAAEAQALKACGGSFEYQDAESFAAIMDKFITSPADLQKAGQAAGGYINANAGAADKCFNAIFN